MSLFKIVGTERACNTTPNNYSSQAVRLFNKGNANYTLTLKENVRAANVAVNTSVNATTLMILGSGNTDALKVNDILVNSSNVAVVNTSTNAVITAIVNSTAFTTNVDIIIASGSAIVYATEAIKQMTIGANCEVCIEKRGSDWLETNENANVLATSISWRG